MSVRDEHFRKKWYRTSNRLAALSRRRSPSGEGCPQGHHGLNGPMDACAPSPREQLPEYIGLCYGPCPPASGRNNSTIAPWLHVAL
jgi:hypothetical protein